MALDGYLLDTCAISALLQGGHPLYQAVRIAIEALDKEAPIFVSRITMAELRFGIELHKAVTGSPHHRADEILRRAEEYEPREVSKHTAVEYAILKSRIAVTYLNNALSSNRPRWIDLWIDRVSGATLQIDENDVWICAQALELNLTLITTDENMVVRISPADPTIKFQLVKCGATIRMRMQRQSG
jgi:tRNA(fMet)-specific endonuclease VapC